MSFDDSRRKAIDRVTRLAMQLPEGVVDLGQINTAPAKGSDTVVMLERKPEMEMYSSSQLQLFKKEAQDLARDSSINIGTAQVYDIPHLKEQFPNLKTHKNRFVRTRTGMLPKDGSATDGLSRYNSVIKPGEVVLVDIVRKTKMQQPPKSFVRAGAYGEIAWGPHEVKAAIVTCGGLCPGLNDVITELFNALYYNYGVDVIYGIKNGLRGFHEPQYRPWTMLRPHDVQGAHNFGGTILGSSRGGFDDEKIIDACLEHGVNQVYIIGGDGTHRAAYKLYEKAKTRGLKMVIAGVPKTIDNDIGVIDRSFGFNTAVEEARVAIKSAVVEASCTPGGIGIVKLMGRHAGYISAHATLASREVDMCLIPEVKFTMVGLMNHVEKVIKKQGYAVMVVAEGAGSDLLPDTGERDASGNKVLPDVGKYIAKQLKAHFDAMKCECSIKYHDPSYMIRSVPANGADSIMCLLLAQNAVHAAMYGFTGFSSGLVNNRSVLLPMSLIGATSPSFLNPNGRTWERVLSLTHQPKFSAEETKKAPGEEKKKDPKMKD